MEMDINVKVEFVAHLHASNVVIILAISFTK